MAARQRVPFVDLSPGIAAQRGELSAALERVLASGAFILGEEVECFERELARYLGVRECVGMSCGSDALVIGLEALGVRPGDDVIVPALSFVATAEAVVRIGARPVFADIHPRTHILDPSDLPRVVTPRTRAVIVVHLYGRAAAMDEIGAFAAERGLPILEDAAQALGGSHGRRKLGSLGAAAALSFFPTKTLGAFGDAGALATDDPAVAALARQLRQHGFHHGRSERIGYNARLDALQAAILRVKLPRLDAAIAERRAAALRYEALLEGLKGVETPGRASVGHAFNYYTVRLDPVCRDRVQALMAERGIETRVYYREPLHQAAAYGSFAPSLALPAAERASRSLLSLPLSPEITASAQEAVAEALREALERCWLTC